MKEKKKNKLFFRSLMKKFKLFFKLFFRSSEFLRNKVVLWLLALNFFLNLTIWLILLFFISKIDVGIILHYNVYFGVDLIGDWKNVLSMPLIGFFIFILNGILAYFFYSEKERVASHILLLTSMMVQLSFLVASFSLILINY